MDKYTTLLTDIATLIADQNRENYFLKHELDGVKKELEAAEGKISRYESAVRNYIKENEEERHA